MKEYTSINDFGQEVDCNYKEDRYSVRDNGEILRHSRVGKRSRPTDNQWTFGKPNDKTGYMEIASIRVHRIVATAFHGDPPTKEHVVDHIDTNKRNNRPENLRWVTKLENVLLNPITVKRIELVCGCSVEEFLADPSKFRDMFQEPNYNWMCTVSAVEAQSSLARMLSWAKIDKLPSGGSLGEWIFNRTNLHNEQSELNLDVQSITVNAVQRDWETPSEFPCCPQVSVEPIIDYAKNLKEGVIFCQNELYSSLVSKSTMAEDRQSIYVITESTKDKNAIKPWALAKIIHENGLFVHISLGNFFTYTGVEKQYCLKLGLEWSGEESIDDYC
jgi:hypothetical protein